MSNPRWTRDALSLSLLWTFLIFAGSVSGSPAFSQVTNFAIGTTVQQPSVKRLGVDLANQDYWDSGQMLRNLIFQNPGFEGNTWQTSIQCAAATATSCTDVDPWTAWTANFWSGATIEVISGAGNGETTTVSGNTISAYSGGNTTDPSYGATLSFAALSTPIAAGDWIIARKNIPGNAQNGWWTSTSGGGSISTDLTDIAPDSPGKQAIELSASGSGQSADVNGAWDTWQTRQFVRMNGTYTIVFKAKGLGGNNVLNVTAQRLATPHGNETFFNQNITLTNEWQDYSYTFTANEDGTYYGTGQLIFSVSGASAYIDDVELNEAAAADNPTAYRNAVVDTLRQLKPGVIRYMDGTDFGASTADIVATPFAREPAGVNGNMQATEAPMGLEEFLVLCQTVGAEPWYTMAGGASVQDMQNLVEFLGGSTSTPYGAIRAALGQSAPWTTVFPKIHIELGNEMWNSSMTGEMIDNPTVYGARAGKLFTAAKASPSYSPVLDLIMGSFAVDTWWTQQEMSTASNYDSIDAAPYLFYSLSDYSSNEAIFGPMFAQPEQIDEPSSPSGNYMAQQAATVATGATPANLEVYEVNLSTVSGTAPQNTVNQVVAGVGAGVAVADHMLLMMRDDGIVTQNMFALTEYDNGFNNTASGASEDTPLWGSVVDMGGETNVQRPQFLAEQLVNDAILPTMLATTVTGANPTWNQPLSANDNETPIQLPTAHYLQSFAFTDGTHYSVIVINLSRSGSLPVTFSGANAPTGNVLVSQLTSTNPTDNNEGLTSDTPVVSPTQTDVSNFNPATPYSLPPFSITAFSWPGSTLPASTTTLAASPTSGPLGQNVVLTATVISQAGSATPTGTVTFMNGSTSLGTATLDSSGAAILSTTSLPAGASSITASYGGDTNDAGSTSSAVTVAVTAPTSTTTSTTTPTTTSTTTPTTTSTTTPTTTSTTTPTTTSTTTPTTTSTTTPTTTSTTTPTTTSTTTPTTTSTTTPTTTSTTTPTTTSTTTPTTTSTTTPTTTSTTTPTTTSTTTPTTTSTTTPTTTSTTTPTTTSTTTPPATTTPIAPGSGTTGSTGTPSYTMALSNSDISITRGELANLTVTITPQNGFNTPITLTCPQLPAEITCSFNPATVTPNGAPVSSLLTISVAYPVSTARNIAPPGSSFSGLALGLAMPWGIFSLLGLSKRKNRSSIATWSTRIAIATALVAGSLWMTGCGYSTNSSVFTMTVASSGNGANVPTRTSQVTVRVAQ